MVLNLFSAPLKYFEPLDQLMPVIETWCGWHGVLEQSGGSEQAWRTVWLSHLGVVWLGWPEPSWYVCHVPNGSSIGSQWCQYAPHSSIYTIQPLGLTYQYSSSAGDFSDTRYCLCQQSLVVLTDCWMFTPSCTCSKVPAPCKANHWQTHHWSAFGLYV